MDDKYLSALFPSFKDLPESAKTFALGAAFGAVMFQWGFSTAIEIQQGKAMLHPVPKLDFKPFLETQNGTSESNAQLVGTAVKPIEGVSHPDELDAAIQVEELKRLNFIRAQLVAFGASDEELAKVDEHIQSRMG